MSRQSILPLPDAQASLLVRGLQPLLVEYPIGRDHRAFVRDFVRVVHDATGRTFSPMIYRKLLAAFAPGRNPSTDTLAKEKQALEDSLKSEAQASREIDQHSGEQLASLLTRTVDSAIAKQARAMPADSPHDRFAQEQAEFLQSRLVETERLLTDVRTQAARYAGELQATQAVRDQLQVQLDTAAHRTTEQAQHIEKLVVEMAGMRIFAMNAIETSRGETRAQQERAAHLEGLLKTEKMHTEVFRRLAYRNGAPIPDSLLPETKA